MRRNLLVALLAVAIAGCAVQPTHDGRVSATMAATERGSVAEGLRALDEKGAADKEDLLGNLERGELLRIDSRYMESLGFFELADMKVKVWEETAKTAPEQLMGQIGATILGETSRAYEGQDYEKVMLTTRMAMNRLNLNDIDNARVDIKRTHEREAVIAEFRAKETVAAEKDAKDRGVPTEGKELSGYPVETLNDAEVLRLKNGYQNALSHYLSGFVYEALNEPGLAAPGYRHAIELRPDTPVLESGLSGLDERTSFRRPKGVTDVLFIIEAGSAPARKSQRVTFPVPTRNGVIVATIMYPVIHPNPSAPLVSGIKVGDQTIAAGLVADFNVMARRSLKDDLPGMQLRAAIRVIAKGVIQDQAYRANALLGIATNIAAIVTEPNADDRMWRALPERIFVARAYVKPGTYPLQLLGVQDNASTVTVQGKYMIVPVRVFASKTYFGQSASFGVLPPTLAQDATAPASATTSKSSAKPPARTSNAASGTTKAPAKSTGTTSSSAKPAGSAASTSAKPTQGDAQGKAVAGAPAKTTGNAPAKSRAAQESSSSAESRNSDAPATKPSAPATK